jgi:hypothetical protein
MSLAKPRHSLSASSCETALATLVGDLPFTHHKVPICQDCTISPATCLAVGFLLVSALNIGAAIEQRFTAMVYHGTILVVGVIQEESRRGLGGWRTFFPLLLIYTRCGSVSSGAGERWRTKNVLPLPPRAANVKERISIYGK